MWPKKGKSVNNGHYDCYGVCSTVLGQPLFPPRQRDMYRLIITGVIIQSGASERTTVRYVADELRSPGERGLFHISLG